MRTEKATVHIRPFTPEEAVTAASWRYPGDLSMYDGEPNNWGQFLAESDTGHGYYAIVDDSELVGFCCFGPEGRVAGQPAKHHDLLDVGGGIRPDLVGRGLGALGLTVILGYARDRFTPAGFRGSHPQPAFHCSLPVGWISHHRHLPRARRPGVHRTRACRTSGRLRRRSSGAVAQTARRCPPSSGPLGVDDDHAPR